MLMILAGLLLPLGAALTVGAWGTPVAVRLAVVLTALVVTDAPLVAAGVHERGAVGVVQPWRWPAYLGWIVIRLLMLFRRSSSHGAADRGRTGPAKGRCREVAEQRTRR
jgi:hypothetical protein